MQAIYNILQCLQQALVGVSSEVRPHLFVRTAADVIKPHPFSFVSTNGPMRVRQCYIHAVSTMHGDYGKLL